MSSPEKQRPIIRHFTPHLDGGLGRVLLSTLRHAETTGSRFAHDIVLLDDRHFSSEAREIFEPYLHLLHLGQDQQSIRKLMGEADISQIEWWNHPIIMRLLASGQFPPARVILCCHVGGLNRPQLITENAVDFADIFLAASKLTQHHPLFADQSDGKEKLRFVAYPVDFERMGEITPRAHDGFAVGYIGTLDYSKLHPDFLTMSASAEVPDIRFYVFGRDQGDRLELQARALGKHGQKFDFRGFTHDVKAALEGFDVFGYPLMRKHFGSGEQALIEAMYAGLPVVVFDNPAEREIVSHNETGLIVRSPEQYSRAIETLYRDPALRRRLGSAAHAETSDRLSPKKCFASLDLIYSEAMLIEKRSRCFRTTPPPIGTDSLGARLFVESLDAVGDEFRQSFEAGRDAVPSAVLQNIASTEPAMKVRTKGSLFQYLYFFPDDPFLSFWASLIRRQDGDHREADRLLACAQNADPSNSQFRMSHLTIN